MERIWLKSYPPGVPADINPGEYRSLVELFDKSVRDYADRPAFHCMGKGITFDSGGVSLKPGDHMWEMKGDMAGSAAVLYTMRALGKLRPDVKVVGILCCAENMPDANAQRPGDIFTAKNGKSIMVDNTDAERGPKFHSTPLALEAAIAGHGVAIADRGLIADHIRNGRLIALFDIVLPTEFAYYLVYPQGREDDPNIGIFRQWLLAEVVRPAA